MGKTLTRPVCTQTAHDKGEQRHEYCLTYIMIKCDKYVLVYKKTQQEDNKKIEKVEMSLGIFRDLG